MRIERHFTSEGQDVFSSIHYRSISIEICHDIAAHRLCIPHFEVPDFWSDEAAQHLVHHFARRRGVPAETIAVEEENVPTWLQRRTPVDGTQTGYETSIQQMVHRLAGTWTYWGWNQGYFDTESDARAFYDEQCHLILHQRAMPAAPQWQHTGLHWAYGLSHESSGNYYVDADSGQLQEATCAYVRPQHHHYFLHGVSGTLCEQGGIADLLQQEMRVFRQGSSAGNNLSQIRSHMETLSSGAACAGAGAFVDIGDTAAQAITGASDNKHRLSMLDGDHPDILDLMRGRVTRQREQMATWLGAGKQRLFCSWIAQAVSEHSDTSSDAYDPAHNAALADVIGQLKARHVSAQLVQHYINELRACGGHLRRFNHHAPAHEAASPSPAKLGIRLSDDFMSKAALGEEWQLKSRGDGKAVMQTDASCMLDEIAHFNWMTGDGFIAFSDNVARWHGCHEGGEIRAASPCGAFAFLDDTACDVAIINLYSLLDNDGEIDIAALEHTARLATIMCDIAIAMAQFPSAEMALGSYRYRPIGLSMCNLSALLMAMGYAYDSAEGRSLGAALAAIITGKGYATSAEMARELGSFEAFSEMREGMMKLMWQHHEAAFGRTQHLGTAQICPKVIEHHLLPDDNGAISDAVQRLWDMAMIAGDEFGYSNAQISLVGANPNAVILMDALSSGIDAPSALNDTASHRNALTRGLTQLGYDARQTQAISHYVFGRRQMMNAPEVNSDALLARGFGEQQLELIEEALQRGMDVHSAFDPLHLGERFCRQMLHLSDAQLYDANFKLLYHLGFDEEAVIAFERYVNGHHSVIGAPFLREEDYAVFATTQSSGEDAIRIEAQILMAASVQPYISGGIAQHVMTPWDGTTQQQRHWMHMAWQLGLKQIMLERAQAPVVPEEAASTPAAPQAEIDSEVDAKVELPQGMLKPALAIHRSVIAAMSVMRETQPPAPTPVSAATVLRQMRALPTKRSGYVQEAHVGGILVRHRTEEYEDGTLAVLTLELPDLEVNLRRAFEHHAAMLTVALQHGVPLEAFEHLASESSYLPCGQVEGHGDITLVQSVTDYLLRDLLPRYAGKQELTTHGALHAAVDAAMEQDDMAIMDDTRDVLHLTDAPAAPACPVHIRMQFADEETTTNQPEAA